MFSMHGPLGRRTFLAGAAALASTPLIGRARAATWPDHPVRFIVPFTPGGTTDLLGRMMAQKLSEEYGQQFVVENKPGAGGNIGGDAVAKSPPDGYTFIVGTPGVHVINQYIYKSQPFDSIGGRANLRQCVAILAIEGQSQQLQIPQFVDRRQ